MSIILITAMTFDRCLSALISCVCSNTVPVSHVTECIVQNFFVESNKDTSAAISSGASQVVSSNDNKGTTCSFCCLSMLYCLSTKFFAVSLFLYIHKQHAGTSLLLLHFRACHIRLVCFCSYQKYYFTS